MVERIILSDEHIVRGTASDHRPWRDRYWSAKAFEALPYAYGERGKFLVDFYTHFRWLDDMVDNPQIPLEQRMELLERQKRLFDGEGIEGPLLPIEEHFGKLPFEVIAGQKEDVLVQFGVLAGTMEEDLDHMGLLPRTRDEMRDYGIRTLSPYAQVISLVLNGYPIRMTRAFEQFLADWCSIGGLLHYHEDLEEGVIKIGFFDSEVTAIEQLPSALGRRKKIEQIMDNGRFRNEWKHTLQSFRAGIASFHELDIPAYQRFISLYYLSVREPLRLPRLFERIERQLASGYCMGSCIEGRGV